MRESYGRLVAVPRPKALSRRGECGELFTSRSTDSSQPQVEETDEPEVAEEWSQRSGRRSTEKRAAASQIERHHELEARHMRFVEEFSPVPVLPHEAAAKLRTFQFGDCARMEAMQDALEWLWRQEQAVTRRLDRASVLAQCCQSQPPRSEQAWAPRLPDALVLTQCCAPHPTWEERFEFTTTLGDRWSELWPSDDAVAGPDASPVPPPLPHNAKEDMASEGAAEAGPAEPMSWEDWSWSLFSKVNAAVGPSQEGCPLIGPAASSGMRSPTVPLAPPSDLAAAAGAVPRLLGRRRPTADGSPKSGGAASKGGGEKFEAGFASI